MVHSVLVTKCRELQVNLFRTSLREHHHSDQLANSRHLSMVYTNIPVAGTHESIRNTICESVCMCVRSFMFAYEPCCLKIKLID